MSVQKLAILSSARVYRLKTCGHRFSGNYARPYRRDREHLEELLQLNKVINTVMILKEKLKHIWTYRSRTWAEKAVEEWCLLAQAVDHPEVTKFAKTLLRYRYGILNHCDFPFQTGRLEGFQ